MSDKKTVRLQTPSFLLCVVRAAIALIIIFNETERDVPKQAPALCDESMIMWIRDYAIEGEEIYILNGATKKVQVFDTAGSFLRGYEVPASGALSIKVQDGLLYVFHERGEYVTVLDSGANIQKEYPLASHLWHQSTAHKNEGYACQNLLGFGSIYDKQTGEVIFRIPYNQSIPLFCVYAGLICGGVIAAVWVIRRVCKESRSGNPAKGDLP